MSKITGSDIQGMVGHWLESPVNGYLGSPYGQDTKALLQRPQGDPSADEYIAKLKEDIAVLQIMPANSINLYGVQTPPDRLDIVLEVSGATFTLNG